ncbi:MAG: hypothetical protein AAF249_11910 [Pseudomonadota bacterium]
MTRKHWFWIGWALYVIASLIKYPPWEYGWQSVAIALGFGLAIILFSRFFKKLEDRLQAGEARFDSETGKQLPPYEDAR